MKRKLRFQDLIVSFVFILFLFSVFEEIPYVTDFSLSPDTVVYITASGVCWHQTAGCSALKNAQIVGIPYQQALIDGRVSCKLCVKHRKDAKGED